VLKYSIKGSRLIVIFIFTAIISGSILTYLSINHISNYRELLEKKISEEERDLSNRFSSGFKNNLDSISSRFRYYLEEKDLSVLQKLKIRDSIKEGGNYIEIDRNGSFLLPNFPDNEGLITNIESSKIYLERLHLAENNEFNVSDFEKANSYYLSALEVATSKTDSVHIYNSMARLYVKMDLQQKAFDAYQTILTEFRSTVNSSGFPYAYFSVIKLLQISNPSNFEELRTLLTSFLEELSDGTIPLNDSSLELMDLIEEWREKNQNQLNNEIFKDLIDRNKNSLLIINNYKIQLKNILRQNNNEVEDSLTNDVLRIKPILDSNGELMLFFEKQPISGGLVLRLEPLFMDVLEKLQFDNLKFEYELNLVDKIETNYLANTNIISTSEFSPYFENNLVQIALKNENIIDENVLKKQLTYGIGLFIFLGTMVLGLYLLIQDVNREKRMNKLRADFVSNVTHELKTPLTSINMFAEAMNLSEETLDSKQKKYASIIVKESEKLKRMINNILEFSKKENDKLSYKLKRSNITGIVNSTLKEMDYFLEINKIEVNRNIEENIYAAVYDEGLKQALSNLISNGIKYSSENKKMNVQLFKKDGKIFIEVEDYGIGIPKDKLDLIFDKFYRVNLNATTSGTGLGLTVSRDIIEEQHGKLLVESTLGKGSKFTIILNIA
jgi:signal transduction histidine kinase